MVNTNIECPKTPLPLSRSELHEAAARRDLPAMDQLVMSRAQVDAVDSEGLTPLHLACANNFTEGVSLLCQHGADVSLRSRDWLTPLHVCAATNSVLSARLIVSSLRTLESTERCQGWTALHLASYRGHTEMVKFLLSHGAKVNSQDRLGRRPLHLAALKGRLHVVQVLLINDADINATDQEMYTPAHSACVMGEWSVLETLLSMGQCDSDAVTAEGDTLLHLACAAGHALIVRMLLDVVAVTSSDDVINNAGQMALHVAAATNAVEGDVCLQLLISYYGASDATAALCSAHDRTALHVTALHGHVQRARALIDKGFAIDAVDGDQCTSLHLAALAGNTELCQLLLDHGANVDLPGPNGMTGLHMAAKQGRADILRLFLKYTTDGARVDSLQRTPLHLAVYSGDLECVSMLVAMMSSTQVMSSDSRGRSLLHYAAGHAQSKVLSKIIQLFTAQQYDTEGRSPLHYAAYCDKDGESVGQLLAAGYSGCCRDIYGYTPIHLSAAAGCSRALELLLDQREALEFLAGSPQTTSVVKEGAGCQNTHTAQSPMHLACYHGHVSCVLHLLAVADYCCYLERGSRVTPLHLAALRGHTSCVRALLQAKADVYARDEWGWTPLHHSASRGQKSCAQLLLLSVINSNLQSEAQSSDVDVCLDAAFTTGLSNEQRSTLAEYVNLLDTRLRSPLMLAVTSCCTRPPPRRHPPDTCMTADSSQCQQLVDLLITCGARVDLVDRQGRTALFRAAMDYSDTCVELLLNVSAGRKTLLATDNHGLTALHVAAGFGACSVLGSFLRRLPAGTADGLLDSDGFSPLHTAAIHGYGACVEILLMCCEKQRQLHGHKFSALHCAAYSGSEKIIAKLIAHYGAACVTRLDHRRRLPLHVAAARGHVICVRTLIGASVQPTKDCAVREMRSKRIPLHLAATGGHTKTCEELVNCYGAALCARDLHGRTPLHLAVMAGRKDTVNSLIDYCQKRDSFECLDIADNARNTALHLAATGGHVRITEALLLAGASVTLKNGRGHTAALACCRSDRRAQCLSLIHTLCGYVIDDTNNNNDVMNSTSAIETVASESETIDRSARLSAAARRLRLSRESRDSGGSDDANFSAVNVDASHSLKSIPEYVRGETATENSVNRPSTDLDTSFC